ncbi:hypothetical protein RHMOL_Rhmol05G0264600 [Rhododendron molle]|uniref:Uncharacterized protein n=1 Tax=Rhododendron molle TaxID=49168 RepID=A0ACC0NTI1_RHOML|nr:hypothetical protein RHMOL_Rhmol05G0264600 [Rhododendron molle]
MLEKQSLEHLVVGKHGLDCSYVILHFTVILHFSVDLMLKSYGRIMVDLKQLNDFLQTNGGCFEFTIQAINLLLQQIQPDQTLSVTSDGVSLQPVPQDMSENDEGEQGHIYKQDSPDHVSPPRNAPDFVFPAQDAQQIVVLPQIAQDLQVAQPGRPSSNRRASGRARLFITQIIQGGGLRNVQNPFGGKGHLGGVVNIEGPQVIQEQNIVDEQPAIEVLAAAGGGNIEVPIVIQEQNVVEPPAIEVLAGAGGGNIEVPIVIQEQNVVDEPPAIEELAGAGSGNIEVPVVIQEQNIVDEQPAIEELAGAGVETSNFGDIGSFEESNNETLNVVSVSGEIKELRVKFETAKEELSRIVLADAFSLNALQDVLREKLPFKFEPLEMNALKDLLVKKFITK